ncbi:DEAD/DEAH box helicase [Microcella sp.]|uniref:DEAD/DEAH box helicase n=1 Tax=Microcella sp. TaxID=1913979 RepID=UPI00256952E7|nr:DEAD/DEAH box helicase [Microcella sp.]MBX9472271.1 DEAD/DEAH box helicase [Microcella sp.]
MPQNNKGGASRNPQNSRTSTSGGGARASAPGSRSPKHRGYRPEDADAPAKKARWSRDERVDRGHAPERARPESASRDERAPRDDRYGRPQRDDRAGRPQRDDRAPRAQYDLSARPQRDDRSGRPQRDDRSGAARTGTGRATHRPDWRPKSDTAGSARPAYRGGRDDRPARDSARDSARDERAARNERSARSFDRDARPARSTGRDERPARTSDRDDRAPRSFDRESRPERRESSFYPSRDAKAGKVDDVLLERLTADAVVAKDVEGITFRDLGLGDNITRTLEDLGAVQPFPIQAATIPDVLAGKDVLGRGRTGSGKTIAFGAPLVERLMENGGGKNRQMGRAPRALILAPTRELALQIDGTVQPIARSVGLFTTQIYGGVPQGRQVGALQRGVDIIIGTPGRIEDLIEQGRLNLSQVEVVVLDEADHMCELGFLEPVQRIIRRTKRDSQKLLFSATLDSGVASLVSEFLRNPSVYEVAGEDQKSSTIEHKVLLVEQRDKRAVIEQLAAGSGKTLVFARTRAFAEELADQLDDAGIPAVSLHGDLNQARRSRNLEKLTNGRVKVLVATDVAARGIHVDDISLVVQADAPDEYKTYLHRSGRTGRAGKVGMVVTLITKPRARRFDELLGRAEITAETHAVRPGDRLLDELAAL